MTQDYTHFLLKMGDFALNYAQPRLWDSVRDLLLLVPSGESASYKFVVAVDIGTAYTKMAWSPTRTAERIVYLFMGDQWEEKGQVPTAVLYKPTGDGWEFAAFGQEAIRLYTEEHTTWALFRRFKMELHKKVHTLSHCSYMTATRSSYV